MFVICKSFATFHFAEETMQTLKALNPAEKDFLGASAKFLLFQWHSAPAELLPSALITLVVLTNSQSLWLPMG